MSQIFMLLAGLVLIALSLVDAFMVMLALQGGGPVTNAWTRPLWKACLALHRRRPMHRVLALVGPAMLVLTIVVWYALLAMGWALLFLSDPDSVVSSQTGLPPAPEDRVYLVGVSLTGIGYGEYVPSGMPWTVLSYTGTFAATFLITTSLSYIMPVLSAAIESRRLARDIHSVGTDAREIVARSWAGPGAGALDDYWISVATTLNHHAQSHEAYPVLHYFHSAKREESPSIAALHFSDALFLAEQIENGGPPEPTVRTIRRALDHFAEITHMRLVSAPESVPEPDTLSAETLRSLGLTPINEPAFAQALRDYERQRKRMVTLCLEDGWY